MADTNQAVTKHTVRVGRKRGMNTAQRNLAALGIGLLLTVAVVLAMFLLEGYQRFELFFLDVRFLWRENVAPIPRTSRIAHVDIDDQSIAALGRWPWNRQTHATFVSTLAALDPRAIVFDVEFPDPVEPFYDRDLVEQNLRAAMARGGVQLDDRPNWDELPAWIQGRLDQILSRAENGRISVQLIETLKRQIREVQEDPQLGRQAIFDAVNRARVDDDRVFALAIARAGRIYLPCSFDPELPWPGDPSVVRAVFDMVSQDIRIDPGSIAAKLGISVADLPPVMRQIKEQVAYDRALETLCKDPTAADDTIWQSLAPGTTEPLSSLSSPDAEVVRQACRKIRSLIHLEEKAALTLSGAPIAEANPVRFVHAPVPTLAVANRGSGFVDIHVDPLDGKLRRLKLVWQAHGTWYPQHMLRVAMDLMDVPRDGVEIAEGPTMVLRPRRGPEIRVPLDAEGRVIMNWAAGEWRDYFGRHVSYSNIVQLSRKFVEAARVLEEVATRRGVAIDMTGWNEALSAIAPAEVLVAAETEMAPREALARLKELEQGAMTAIAEAKREVDEEILTLDEDSKGRLIHKRLLDRQTDLATALAKAEKLVAEAEFLEDRIRPLVAGKICLVGSTHFASTDLKPTPLQPNFPGVALHSNLFNMLENAAFLRRASSLTNAGIAMFVGLLVTLVSIQSGPVRAGLLALGILILYLLVGFWAFMAHGLWLDFLGPIAATISCYAMITAFKEAMQANERKKVEALWGQYVSPAVVDLLLENPELQKIFAERRMVTMLFSDVAGFTKESERLDAETVSHLINIYLDEMSQPIVTYDGYLNKYEGDAIMAFWGAPIAQADQAVRACFAALDMMARLKELQKGFKEKGLPMMHTRIGINTGLVFVGNFGSKRKFDYTAIGDHVNLASRLEGANKAFGTACMIADSTYQGAKEFVEVRKLGRIRVVGRENPVGIYELLARTGELTQQQKEMREAFEQGLAHFEKREWPQATEWFRRVIELVPDDGPSKVYIRLTAEYRAKELPPNWDGVIALESK